MVVGSLPTVQLSVAICAGIVAATFAPSVRRSIPRWLEAGLWIALIVLCWLSVTTTRDASARELTSSTAWAGWQIANTAFGLVGAGLVGWMSGARFALATWVVILCGVDILLLALLSSRRKGRGWQPRVRLRDWIELPPPVAPKAVVVPEYAIDALNRRCAAAIVVAAAAVLTWTVNLVIWMRDVLLPRKAQRLARAAASGQAQLKARLESLRITALALQLAARAWYMAACAPSVEGLVAKAGEPRRGLRTSQVLDLRPLLSARSIGWYGPLARAQPENESHEADEIEADRLAS